MHDSPEGHTNVVFGGGMAVKLFRRTEPGVHPDLELRRFLTERTSFHALPAVLGASTTAMVPRRPAPLPCSRSTSHTRAPPGSCSPTRSVFYDELAGRLPSSSVPPSRCAATRCV